MRSYPDISMFAASVSFLFGATPSDYRLWGGYLDIHCNGGWSPPWKGRPRMVADDRSVYLSRIGYRPMMHAC